MLQCFRYPTLSNLSGFVAMRQVQRTLDIREDLGPFPKSTYSEGSLQSRVLDVSENILKLVHCSCKMAVAVHLKAEGLIRLS